ncbi:NAD-P-binding protein [Lactarius akahatsu]|uniref:NAD-P-binding protein n=1 Tax=Lactarius akahatsu TaxID=416441 RepID=A0AAD4LNE1_9AGAM|nr:NAD-P-binding protein [Lactarius akahatsu]
MSGYKKFVVVGAGNLGSLIVEELLKQKAAGAVEEITIVTRPASKDNETNKAFAARGARIAAADLTDVSALTTALGGAHVVISTVSLTVIDAQVPVAQAAKAAGAHVFIPSEFGGPTDHLNDSLLGLKGALHAKLREVGPPLLLVYTGPTADTSWVGSPLVATGNAPISFTARNDVARFLVYVLVRAPAARLQNQTLRLEGDRASFNEIFKGYEERTGKKLDVTYRSLDSLRAKVAENPQDFDAYLHLIWATDGTNGTPDNGLYPEWNPTKVLDIIAPRK